MNNNIISTNIDDKNFRIISLFPEAGLADPHALVDGDDLYVICGHDKTWHAQDTWLMDRWEILHTKDLVNWEMVGSILPQETYIGNLPNCWAGNLKKKNNKYYWFFSNKFYNIGVLVSDSPKGPYIDVLKKPLIESDVIESKRVYDPTVYVENDIYYMIFGSGIYHIARLNDDLLSLAEPAKPITVLDKDSNTILTGDKSTLFKRNNIYYLVWGGYYAMSENLFGPYIYKGEYGYINHNDFFIWKNRWYMMSEFPETTHFYRGVSVMAVNFNDDQTLAPPPLAYPTEKIFSFKNSTIGWHGANDEILDWDQEGYIKGEIKNKNEIIESVLWPGIRLNVISKIEICLKNASSATKAQIQLAVPKTTKKMFSTPEINWDMQQTITFDIHPYDISFTKYTIDIPLKYDDIELKRVRLYPALNANSGQYQIKELRLF